MFIRGSSSSIWRATYILTHLMATPDGAAYALARRQQARVRPEKARRWRFHVGALGRGARWGEKGQTCEGER